MMKHLKICCFLGLALLLLTLPVRFRLYWFGFS